MPRSLDDAGYQRLLKFRTGLRRFEHWSQLRAAEVGLTASQHQLILAVRGHPDARGPTIGDVADYLQLRHHSVVGLVDRAASAGLVHRVPDPSDARVVRLSLTSVAEERLASLAAVHLEELSRLGPELQAIWQGLDEPG
ncbi:MAG: MarR family transcriptional regulator [Acidimicrobiia bacterium]|nr:MarR family transcriptional regulator [Acidimicrobiia bacterium]